ncbi:hypothetical protein E1B28_009307 [Marasmius oreades]|uniref:Cytochrome P450 n=1 Tax=Marasmius oreades TaxID=181124 RepID=A0A9P7S0Q8_9AGAR|nr:uncharacterized protein E1B28_009307 [Marasmius oreades]KAG7093008.1 hypothetical protein E1B28_009307 [Marasmius oreades]
MFTAKTLFASITLAVLSSTVLYGLQKLLSRLQIHILKTECTQSTVEETPLARSFWYIGTLDFFLNPFMFLASSITQAKGRMFSFRVLSDTVIMLRGIPGRDAFFSKGLDFMSGYRLLNPQLVDIMPIEEVKCGENGANFMATLIRTEVLEEIYLDMLSDVSRRIDGWGDEGTIDPFLNVYEIVFALSVRLSTCHEFIEDPAKVNKLMSIFERLEAGSTPTGLILPWLPTPARVGRTIAGAQLYTMISKVVRNRQQHDIRREDPLQALIDKKFPMADITRFTATTLFAAVTNTGNALCWVLIYLEVHKEWKSRVVSEIQSFVQDAGAEFTDSMEEAIGNVSLQVMDEKTPTLDLVINETIRLLFDGTFMRRNIGNDIFVGAHRIEHGAYLMFPTADLHFNEDLFPNSREFDPLRFTPEEVDKRNVKGINFLGWGAGRHICVGKRAAMLMMKLILIMLVSKLETRLVSERGESITAIPEAKLDRLFKVCQTKDKIYLDFYKRGMRF